jgi:hypothetical protein
MPTTTPMIMRIMRKMQKQIHFFFLADIADSFAFSVYPRLSERGESNGRLEIT